MTVGRSLWTALEGRMRLRVSVRSWPPLLRAVRWCGEPVLSGGLAEIIWSCDPYCRIRAMIESAGSVKLGVRRSGTCAETSEIRDRRWRDLGVDGVFGLAWLRREQDVLPHDRGVTDFTGGCPGTPSAGRRYG